MSLIGNLVWLLLGGFIAAIAWAIAGLLLCVTVVGIPFGIQCFKIASLSLSPFGREINVGSFGAIGLLGNILWIVLLGWELCLLHLSTGALLCITVVGIPFGMQHFKLASLALLPFGSRV